MRRCPRRFLPWVSLHRLAEVVARGVIVWGVIVWCVASRTIVAAAAAAETIPTAVGVEDTAKTLQACLLGASRMHRVPPSVLVMLLQVEGGRLGMRSPNTNGTGDLGPFQVNETWVPKVAKHWGVTEAQAYALLRDDLCSNTEAAAWILGQALADAGGDFWGGVGRYHSANPVYQRPYLHKVLTAAQTLLRRAAGGQGAAPR